MYSKIAFANSTRVFHFRRFNSSVDPSDADIHVLQRTQVSPAILGSRSNLWRGEM